MICFPRLSKCPSLQHLAEVILPRGTERRVKSDLPVTINCPEAASVRFGPLVRELIYLITGTWCLLSPAVTAGQTCQRSHSSLTVSSDERMNSTSCSRSRLSHSVSHSVDVVHRVGGPPAGSPSPRPRSRSRPPTRSTTPRRPCAPTAPTRTRRSALGDDIYTTRTQSRTPANACSYHRHRNCTELNCTVAKNVRPQTHGHHSVKSQPIFQKNFTGRFCSKLVITNPTTPCICCHTTL